MDGKRCDLRMVELGLVPTRSRAENLIKLSQVSVNKKIITKPGFKVFDHDLIEINSNTVQFVSRAAYKLDSVIAKFGINFKGLKILDIGSSTGGFTDYALYNGGKKVIAIELGKDQLDPKLRSDPRIELHEKTDILDVSSFDSSGSGLKLSFEPDLILVDLSFVSILEMMSKIYDLAGAKTNIIIMVKPQFEATKLGLKHKGIIKNEKIRRQILNNFEIEAKRHFILVNKADSAIIGSKGNRERFYLLKKSI